MEQRKIKLTTSTTTTFDLEKEEIKTLYTYLSLHQYRSLRTPDYDERELIKALEKDFKKYFVEIQKQTERDPNNLMLNRIRTFFDIHYKKIKTISEEYDQMDDNK